MSIFVLWLCNILNYTKVKYYNYHKPIGYIWSAEKVRWNFLINHNDATKKYTIGITNY